jgi:hypothetical protein
MTMGVTGLMVGVTGMTVGVTGMMDFTLFFILYSIF